MKQINYVSVLRRIGLKNYATFVDEYGNETYGVFTEIYFTTS